MNAIKNCLKELPPKGFLDHFLVAELQLLCDPCDLLFCVMCFSAVIIAWPLELCKCDKLAVPLGQFAPVSASIELCARKYLYFFDPILFVQVNR